jgi:hypothetical protein
MSSVTACLDISGGTGGSDPNETNKPSLATIRQDVGGIVTAEITASTDRPQQVNASPSSAISGAAVLFPSGSLPASTSVTIQQGESVILPTLPSTLGLAAGNQLSEATRAVVVTAATSMDATSPFAIALPITTDSTSLTDGNDLSKLVIIYIALDASSNQSRIGVIPNTELVIVDGRIQFKTKHFGLYQGAFTANPLTERIDRPTKKSILTSKIAATLPGVSWQPVSASYLNGQLQVSTTVNGVVSLQECLVILVEDKSSWPIFTAVLGAATTGSVPMTVPKPGSYLAQLICTEENGRVVTSPWSKPVIFSNASSPPPPLPSPIVKTDKVNKDSDASSTPLSWQQPINLFSNIDRAPNTPFMTTSNPNGATLVIFTGAGGASSSGTFAGMMSDSESRKATMPMRIGEPQAMESMAAAIDNSGNALVLWPQLAEDGNSHLSGSFFNAMAQDQDAWTFLDPVINSSNETMRLPGTVVSHASVATDPTGHFRAIWVEQSADEDARLYNRIFDHASKTWVGDAQMLHSEALDLSTPPLIRIDSLGNTAVLSSIKGNDSHTLRLDYAAASSSSNWSTYTIATSLLSTEIDSLNWAMDPSTGQSFIVWWDSVTGFKARSFIRGKSQGIATLSVSGPAKDGQRPLQTIQAGVDQLGNAVFAWRARDGVYASYLERGATAASEAALISTLDLDELYLTTDSNTGNSVIVGVQRVNGRVDIHTIQRQANKTSWSAISTLNLIIPLKDPTLVLAQGGLSVTASGIFNLLWASDENSSINLIQLR